MKKLLVILAALVLALSCCAIAFADVEVDPELYPILPTGKDVMQNPHTYCNPISLTIGSGRVQRGGEPVVRVYKDDYYLTANFCGGY